MSSGDIPVGDVTVDGVLQALKIFRGRLQRLANPKLGVLAERLHSRPVDVGARRRYCAQNCENNFPHSEKDFFALYDSKKASRELSATFRFAVSKPKVHTPIPPRSPRR